MTKSNNMSIWTSASVLLLLVCSLVSALPSPQASPTPASGSSSSYWVANIQRQGTVAYGSNSAYTVFRNVKDPQYGAKGDGSTDDTAAINKAISDGNRCGQGCNSSTTTPAIIYFPPGNYLVSSPIIQYYYTQFIGDAVTPPTITASSSFQGLAIMDSDVYIPGGYGQEWYVNQNNFYRQIRNFVIDMTKLPTTQGVAAGIHWQVAQATSLQNIVFNMVQQPTSTNKQQGIFMENGSGGFMSDLVFNGGGVGASFGNQQFTTRNMTFNNCYTAISMNWNWLWTMKSTFINNCQIGLDMSAISPMDGTQTVGSVILMDSKITGTPTGVVTSYNKTSLAATAGTLVIQNVDFSGCQNAIVDPKGNTILAGHQVVSSWVQGNAYQPAGGASKAKRETASTSTSESCDSLQTYPTVPVKMVNSTAASSSTIMVSPIPAPTSSSGAASASASSYGNSTSTLGSSNPALATSSCSSTAAPVTSARISQGLTSPTMAADLLGTNGAFERSKPQYESIPASSFVSVKSMGAKGDGITDDTQAIQSFLNSFNGTNSDKIAYFDHGAYLISNTVRVPSTIKITGEIWPLIMISGSTFSDANNPAPAFQVGNPGDVGAVEMSDLIFETRGAMPGAVMMEWNVEDVSQGSCGMWDVHFRVGGSAGTELEQDTCIGNTTNTQTFNPQCAGSFLMLHITQTATAYLENVWLWTADHELDIAGNEEVNIYNGRGMLVSSQGPVWLYGTSVEHSQFYNYQLVNAKNIFMAAIQTETAYMQNAPDALHAGFTPNAAYGDPTFDNCGTGNATACAKTWGLRVVDSTDIWMYGGGLYSFFDNYLEDCLNTTSCQQNMISIECSQNVNLYNLNTIGTTNMVTVDGTSQAKFSDNENGKADTIALFQAV